MQRIYSFLVGMAISASPLISNASLALAQDLPEAYRELYRDYETLAEKTRQQESTIKGLEKKLERYKNSLPVRLDDVIDFYLDNAPHTIHLEVYHDVPKEEIAPHIERLEETLRTTVLLDIHSTFIPHQSEKEHLSDALRPFLTRREEGRYLLFLTGKEYAETEIGFAAPWNRSAIVRLHNDENVTLNTLLHEMGHLFGLDHVDDSRYIMHPKQSASTTWHPRHRSLLLRTRFEK